MDLDKNGIIERKDYEILADKVIENGNLSGSQAESVKNRVMNVWKATGIPDNGRVGEEEFVRIAAASISGARAVITCSDL